MNKAPAGGMASQVNGQWYEGGEFMPVHGLFCGKDKNRVTMQEFERVKEAVAAAGKILRYDEKTGDFIVAFLTGNIAFRARNLGTISKCF